MHEELVKNLLQQQAQQWRSTAFPLPWKLVSVRAPVNIALIKYWGKDDEDLIIPSNDSLSITLGAKEALVTETTVIASAAVKGSKFENDSLELNGDIVKLYDADSENIRRYQRVLSIFRNESSKRKTMPVNSYTGVLKILSDNNFPTAAGLASSASGFAALAFALKYVFDVPESFNVSCVARQGSGSACRSMQGGFVLWSRSKSLQNDFRSSCIDQLFDENHWKDLCCLACVLKSDRKATGSTAGMRRAPSSPLYAQRLQAVPKRIEKLIAAVKHRDFAEFGAVVMEESDELHQLCETSVPSLCYLTDDSKSMIGVVRNFNNDCGCIRAAYTFDAGPNAFLFFERTHAKEFLSHLGHFCDIKRVQQMPQDLTDNVKSPMDSEPVDSTQARIKIETVIFCNVGRGPELVCYCNCTDQNFPV